MSQQPEFGTVREDGAIFARGGWFHWGKIWVRRRQAVEAAKHGWFVAYEPTWDARFVTAPEELIQVSRVQPDFSPPHIPVWRGPERGGFEIVCGPDDGQREYWDSLFRARVAIIDCLWPVAVDGPGLGWYLKVQLLDDSMAYHLGRGRPRKGAFVCTDDTALEPVTRPCRLRPGMEDPCPPLPSFDAHTHTGQVQRGHTGAPDRLPMGLTAPLSPCQTLRRRITQALGRLFGLVRCRDTSPN